ncbi:HAD family phosphatase [Patescibacteria group bacterium]|nr:HAD family phosphatase [Patescibacteria group bacterium]
MIKAVIFDLNGVFILAPLLSKKFEQDFNIDPQAFIPALDRIMDTVRRPGAGPAFGYWQPELEKLGIKMSEQEFWQYWFGSEKESPEMLSLAEDLRAKGIKVIILSNNFKERTEYYGNYPRLRQAADKVYYSWNTGFMKPDARAWQFVLDDNGLKPEECIYFDDKDVNIKTAAALGLQARMFVDAETTREILEEEGVL